MVIPLLVNQDLMPRLLKRKLNYILILQIQPLSFEGAAYC